jgi:hypothetical protein
MEKGNLWTVNKKYMKVQSRKGGVVFLSSSFVFFNLLIVKNPSCNKFTKVFVFFLKKNKKFLLYSPTMSWAKR